MGLSLKGAGINSPYSKEEWMARLEEVRVARVPDTQKDKMILEPEVTNDPTWVTCFAVPPELKEMKPPEKEG